MLYRNTPNDVSGGTVSTILYTLGRWSFRHPWRVLVSWLLLLALAGGGAALFMKGTDNTFSIPGTESQAGLEQLGRTFPQVSGTNAQFIVVAAPGDAVTDDAYRTSIESTIASIEDLDGVLAVTDPYDDAISGSISDDESAAIVRMQFDGQATDVPAETKTALEDVVGVLEPPLADGSQVELGGDLFAVSLPGVTVTELIGLIIALLVLIVTFRSFVVAGLPLLTAILGVGLSMALIFLATAFATVSSTTPLLALMLGLAVGIDYSLFIISRHQDQTRAGVDPEESAARATGTAGSAVVFAGLTVLIALIGLGFAGIPFLTTMGIAASVAVAIAVLVAVTLTPALLGFVRGRVVGWRRRPRTHADKPAPERRGFALRWVTLVTRHPVVTTVAVVVTLGVAAIPAASLALALPNAGQLPEDDQARIAYDLTSEHFGPGANGPLIMTGTIVTSTDPVGLMTDLGDDIATIPGVKEVALATPNETADTGIVQIVPETAPDDPATADLVRELRAQHDRLLDEYGVDLKVTGFTAVAIDISDRLGAALVPFGIFVVGLSLVLLMIVFRSIWVPIKAALGFLLSVAASFGIVAAVFEWGWFADALHVARTGPVISFMPIVVMGVLFGLAMDYEVFLVSRMREDYVHARRNGVQGAARQVAIGAIRSGFTASARVVTAAAVIMFAVFAAFVPEGDANLKPIALGLAVGVLIDAFLVRMTLVPAVMALLGSHAWWFPRWLDRLLPHFDIEGEAVERELALADWPGPDSTAVIVSEDLALRGDHGTVFGPTDLRVEPGEAIIVTSDDPHAVRALALTVAGRLPSTDGRLRVAGHLLPERAAWVRARTGIALLEDADEPIDELQRAVEDAPAVIVLDGLDALARVSRAARERAIGMLRDAASGRTAAVLATVSGSAADVAAARTLLTDAGFRTTEPVTLPVAPTAEVFA
jgi:RND superfamily putative drug exporter